MQRAAKIMMLDDGERRAPWMAPRPPAQQYPPRPGPRPSTADTPYFPFAYTLFTLALQLGIGLTAAQFGPAWLAMTLFSLLAVWVFYVAARFSYDYIMERVVGWVSVVGLVDVYIAYLVVFSGVWQGLVLLDATQFANLPAMESQYRLYVSFLFAAAGLVSTVGFGTSVPRGALAELWGVFGILSGIWFLTLLFVVRPRLNLALAPQMPQSNPTLIQLDGTGEWIHAEDLAWHLHDRDQ